MNQTVPKTFLLKGEPQFDAGMRAGYAAGLRRAAEIAKTQLHACSDEYGGEVYVVRKILDGIEAESKLTKNG